jgi:GR25 family glycosyltransferase involved in LPS biosynthesis
MIYEKFLKTDYETLLVLEDDCLFLPSLTENVDEVLNDIYSVEWDIFWLGCRNRILPLQHKDKTYKVLSVSHAQSYIIKRDFCTHLLENYPIDTFSSTAIDELLCLAIYGKDVVADPNKYNFYQLNNPSESLTLHFTSLCYEDALTTQYPSYSDLWHNDVNYSQYLIQSFPIYNKI